MLTRTPRIVALMKTRPRSPLLHISLPSSSRFHLPVVRSEGRREVVDHGFVLDRDAELASDHSGRARCSGSRRRTMDGGGRGASWSWSLGEGGGRFVRDGLGVSVGARLKWEGATDVVVVVVVDFEGEVGG